MLCLRQWYVVLSRLQDQVLQKLHGSSPSERKIPTSSKIEEFGQTIFSQ